MYRRRSRIIWFCVCIAMALVGAVILSIHRRTGLPVKRVEFAAQSDYVDPDVCASCHQDVAATYRMTGMGRSFSSPTKATVVEDYARANTVRHQLSDFNYKMFQRNGEYFQLRSQVGPDGKETNVMEARIDYIIGSGSHSRSYLHRAPDGQLIELPVSWYSENSGFWAMSPGYDRKDQSDFRRAIKSECMFCHNGYPELGASLDAGLDRSIFPEKLPEGIDCQRCHGPGRAHVDAAKSAHPAAELLSKTIVNPGSLGRERQLEVCMQCHLETTIHEPNEQRLFDNKIFSYRPGEPLGDYKLYFEPLSAPDDTFEIASAAYRLRKSACFRNSKMTCLTCHDPHDIPRGQEAVKHYTEVCLTCHRNVAHTVALPSQSTCLTCHMPKRRTDDVVHAVMTEHFIRRSQPRGNLLSLLAETASAERTVPKVRLYYPEAPATTPAVEIATAEAQINDNGIPRLQALLERYQPNVPEPYLALAKAYENVGNNDAVIRWSQQALTKSSYFRPAIIEIVPALFASHSDAQAARMLEQAVEHYPLDDLLLSDLGNAYLRQGQITQAAETLKRAINANPDRAESHNLLGVVYLKQGGEDKKSAERELREALRCNPNFSEANDNLGGLMVEKQRYKEAANYFQIAVSNDPSNASMHHHLGKVLVLTDQLQQALSELREAAQLDPNDLLTSEDLADLYAATGHAAEAMSEYEHILQRNPTFPPAQLGLGMTLLTQNKVVDARQHLESAAQSSDVEFAKRAAHVLQGMPEDGKH